MAARPERKVSRCLYDLAHEIHANNLTGFDAVPGDELVVCCFWEYPATRARFTISLRVWQGALWAVKVIPETPRMADAFNPFVQQHRLLARPGIEEWLARLRVTRKPAKLANP